MRLPRFESKEASTPSNAKVDVFPLIIGVSVLSLSMLFTEVGTVTTSSVGVNILLIECPEVLSIPEMPLSKYALRHSPTELGLALTILTTS